MTNDPVDFAAAERIAADTYMTKKEPGIPWEMLSEKHRAFLVEMVLAGMRAVPGGERQRDKSWDQQQGERAMRICDDIAEIVGFARLYDPSHLVSKVTQLRDRALASAPPVAEED